MIKLLLDKQIFAPLNARFYRDTRNFSLDTTLECVYMYPIIEFSKKKFLNPSLSTPNIKPSTPNIKHMVTLILYEMLLAICVYAHMPLPTTSFVQPFPKQFIF